jgi:hypothetical protein
MICTNLDSMYQIKGYVLRPYYLPAGIKQNYENTA